MDRTDTHAVTRLLQQMAQGDPSAANQLLPRVYAELHALAEQTMRRRDAPQTLQPTELIHEAWMRLAGGAGFENREHFAAVAARAMRSVLVDHARRRRSDKRGGGAERVPLDALDEAFSESVPDMLALDEALDRLAAMDAQLGRLVELRFFAGLSVEETAAVLGVSEPTVTRGWRAARMWLRRELESEPS